MIEAVISLMKYSMQREQVSLVLMKQRMQAEAAMAQLLMDAAKNANQATSAASGHIDMYV
jgi:hypothetical protein